ncbi:MAG: class I SAM-dependent methyltransferase [Promethearchaeota archaeon]
MSEKDPYDEIAECYDYLLPEDSEAYIESIFQMIQERYPNLKDAILADIGGGTGRLTFQIYDRIGKIILVDPSKKILNIAKSKFNSKIHTNIEFRQAGFPNCGLEKNSIDIIAVINAFGFSQSVEEQLLALKDIYQSLKRGGLLFIDNNNFYALIRDFKSPQIIEREIENQKITIIGQHEIFPHKQLWVHTYTIFLENIKTGEIKKKFSKFEGRMMSSTEMFLLLKEAGFIDIEITTPPQVDEKESASTWFFVRKPNI